MTLISYAQNFEDVMLNRAFGSIEKGFYIDVGAQDPQKHSVTKAFYDRGWLGINIEPARHWFDQLVRERPHDTTLCVAASDQAGEIRFFNIKDTGLSTTNAEYARRHSDAGFEVDEEVVPCTTLDDVCAEHHVGTVHFLKIDCEGAEEAVLRGFSLSVVRPWIVLVEATEPLGETPVFESWQELLTTRGYHFVYDDGLNRFYVADEHAELDKAFAHPPNVFDDFLRDSEYALMLEHQAAQAALENARNWQKVTEFLQGENERREAALVGQRSQIELDHADRMAERQAQEHAIGHLRSENERREAALVELRRRIEEMTAAHADQRRAQDIATEYLRSENERREAALVEHRRQIEETSAAYAIEREAHERTIERLQSENERREAALVELRNRIESMDAELAVERLAQEQILESSRRERERHELALAEHRGQMDAANRLLVAQQEEQARATDILRAENQRYWARLAELQVEIDARNVRITAVQQQMLETQAASDGLRAQLAHAQIEAARFQDEIRQIRTSTSWRITSPLRAAKLTLWAVTRFVARLLRGGATAVGRSARPALRHAAQWEALRRPVVAALGKDSALVAKSRMFLFGDVRVDPETEQVESSTNGEPVLEWEARRVYRELGTARSAVGNRQQHR